MDVESLAEKIAERLFRNYESGRVQRLVLTDDIPKRDWGGWSFGPAADAIASVLREQLKGEKE